MALQKPEVWVRIQLCMITGVILFLVTGGWAPPFKYRVRSVPTRDMYARVRFEYTDLQRTKEAKEKASRAIPCFYENDRSKLEDVRNTLMEQLFDIKDKPFDQVNIVQWKSFFDQESVDGLSKEELQEAFNEFSDSIANDENLAQLKHALQVAFISFEQNGLLTKLEHEPTDGSMLEIQVIPINDLNIQLGKRVESESVRIAAVSDQILEKIRSELKNQSAVIKNSDLVADHLFHWIRPRLPDTLKFNRLLTKQAQKKAAEAIGDKKKVYEPGDPLDKLNSTDPAITVIKGGQALDEVDIQLLRAEHREFVRQMSWSQIVLQVAAHLGMYTALLSFLVAYLYYRDGDFIDDVRKFSTLLGLFLVAICAAWLLAFNLEGRLELIPLTFFAMTVAIAFHREVAVVMSAIASLVFTVSHGYDLPEFVVLVATTATASLLCGSIRSRTRLVYVGLIAAAVAFPTTIGVSTLLGQPMSRYLWLDATYFGLWAMAAGVMMTALLPFLEQWFEIQTDISLLELSDANHPLLRELVQRAPGTYNHSLNVASMAEAAAESVGANGLLCRVGGYFHDIGKMRKPDYFIENQSGKANPHDDLVPSMSTLVIIAHVKDGAEMARNHRLPQRIVDLIEQHHGTTMVEYFYRQAVKLCEEGGQVEESDFRYPGQKPQTLEAAVMMIADAVESASRSLKDPAPARLETLVREIIKKRLDDDQFDECPITMEQLSIVEQSLIKSLNATHHARVQYPEGKPESDEQKKADERSAEEQEKRAPSY